ncbi:hypothetical protein D3C77_392450 [compost metagenome]
MLDRIFNRSANKTLGALSRYRLDSDSGSFREADFAYTHFILQERKHLFHFFGAFLVFYTCINIFCILTEDHHIYQFRTFHWRRHTVEIAYRTQTYIQVKLLPQSYVQGTDTTADGCRKRTFDRYNILANRSQRISWQPLSVCIVGFLSGENFIPSDLLVTAISFLYGSIQNTLGSLPNITPRAIALNEWDDRIVRHLQLAVLNFNFLPFCRQSKFF